MKGEQVIILAAGKGTRLRPLTTTRPKPLLKAGGKTILEHKLDNLSCLVREVVLVIGYRGEMIKDLIGERYKNLKIKYVWQKEPLGTGDALLRARDLLKEKFLLLYGDDIYIKDDIEKCLQRFPSISVTEVKNPSSFGVVVPEKDFVKDFLEKPKEFVSNLVSTGILFLPKSILQGKLEESKRGEYELPDFLQRFIKKEKLYFMKAEKWIPVSYPWDILKANEFFLKKEKRKIEGRREENCHISGPVVVQKGTIIKSGTYIEGPVFLAENCQIGPNCYLRKFTTIGKNCKIGQAVEIKNSVIGDGTKISHLSYVGDSVIGQNCNLGAGTICANLRFDEKTIKTEVKGEKIDTKRRKFGCAIGDGTKIGIHVSIMPGILIGANCTIWPLKTVFKNIKDNEILKGS